MKLRVQHPREPRGHAVVEPLRQPPAARSQQHVHAAREELVLPPALVRTTPHAPRGSPPQLPVVGSVLVQTEHLLEGVHGAWLLAVGGERELDGERAATGHEDLDGVAWGEIVGAPPHHAEAKGLLAEADAVRSGLVQGARDLDHLLSVDEHEYVACGATVKA